ncbi:helix-turn-helix transcriptional regulator [Kitasatospora sp. NPDC006697]|uniref:helix-turn-helix transcriptional regulator n=1 Tax=Kitasatospora sp. NPDC006697 TaxID=3364020 RepID=UPI0036746B9B
MAEDLNRQLGQLVRRLRNEKELTQGQLADRVELTRTSITNIEKGRQALSVALMVKVARGLNADPVRLLEEALRAADGVAINSVNVPSEVAAGVASPELLGWVLDVLNEEGAPPGTDSEDERFPDGQPLHATA